MSSLKTADGKIDIDKLANIIDKLNKEITRIKRKHDSLVRYINSPFDKLPSYSPPQAQIE